MSCDFEKNYLKHKEKNIINLVNRFNTRYGYEAFTLELNQNNLEKKFCNSKICSNCGECCSKSPCIFSPNDFLDICDMHYMKNILNTGLICISKSPDDNVTLILRPRGKEDVENVYSWTRSANHCILENGKGCMLPIQYRPSQGIMLIPRDDEGTILHTIMYPNFKVESDYKPYQKILETLIYEYRHKTIPYYENENEESIKRLIKSLEGYDKKSR